MAKTKEDFTDLASVAPAGRCTVGPVIGRVTTTTARVLVEVGVQVEQLTVSLKSGDQPAKEVTRAQPPKSRPILFAFEDLAEGTKYTVTVSADGSPWKNCNASVPSTLKTMTSGGPCKVGVVSCNKIYVTRKKQKDDCAWELLLKRVQKGDLDCLLHVGDQVYADHEYGDYEDGPKKLSEEQFLAKLQKQGDECVFAKAKLHLQSLGGFESWAQAEDEVKEMFRALYRETWGWPATAAVLANIPNTMIPDDHEFRDDWGDREEDYDRKSVAYCVARCGYRIYREYQAALNGGAGDKFAEKPHEFYPEHLVIPDFLPQQKVGLLALDTRCKGFTQESYPYKTGGMYPSADGGNACPFLGMPQWQAVEAALGDGGAFREATCLLVVATCPPLFLGAKGTKFVTDYLGGNDFLGSWGAERNLPELVRLLDGLRAWKGRNANRQIVMVGGDVHSGLVTDVKHNGALIFQQLTASAVANKTLTAAMAGAQKFLQEVTEDDFPAGYSVDHKTHEWRSNYGSISIPSSVATDPAARIAVELHGAGKESQAVVAAVEVGNQAGNCCGCSIL
mmetsp:Transcript_42171/g.86223  ORF Transcript_42171/g.86223 Transcript_42171/m.86223 type:complete len:563 (+) Transcript_42171:63-1751(+)|eukprot:CAMPEP_0181317908 /NCGR_PEP_ID=MMETSP1101-20121128/16720_1 /TAXON_ID=46948 /ORGANISM="Rhodomonas abbreviata, Strain Caron Lab Isolate" /LENGTH=562 /DNA_ID=CAMNT_0023425335 /DNA_START=63 /DNA_END=1751 /DNA_ORIENTATION=+